jgi:hypothetical protein
MKLSLCFLLVGLVAVGRLSFADSLLTSDSGSGQHEPVVHLTTADPVYGVVSAGSTYSDTGLHLPKVNTIGSATVVRLGATGKLAVLTASHVVGGRYPWVEIKGIKYFGKPVFLDNDNDVAIIDLGNIVANAALDFSKEELKATPEFTKRINEALVPTVLLAYYLPGHTLGFALRPWVDSGVETAKHRAIQHAPIVSLNYSKDQVRIYTKVTSGASGSAVLDLKTQKVAGLIVQSHYYFSETYLATVDVLTRDLRIFLSGIRGPLSETKWKMHNSLEYRIFAGGIEEANFTNRPTSGVVGQPGAGIVGQPGAGIVGQPGHGVVGQPGLGTIGQPAKGKKAFQPWTESPRAVFEHYKILPGMVWNGEQVSGLRVRAKTEQSEWPKNFNLLAESEAFKFMNENQTEFAFEAIKGEVNYVELLRERLQLTDSEQITLKSSFGPSAIVDDEELKPLPQDCRVDVFKDRIQVRVKTYSRIDRTSWKLIPDTIEFTIGTNGALQGQEGFLPVIETKGLQSGETYFVDLRQFFFTDLSQLIRPMPDWSAENPPFGPERFDIKAQMRTVGFSVRNAKSGAEFTYGFVAPEKTNQLLQPSH